MQAVGLSPFPTSPSLPSLLTEQDHVMTMQSIMLSVPYILSPNFFSVVCSSSCSSLLFRHGMGRMTRKEEKKGRRQGLEEWEASDSTTLQQAGWKEGRGRTMQA